MKRLLPLLFLYLIPQYGLSQDIDDVAKTIRESQLNDETNDWVYWGTFKGALKGINNSLTSQLRIDDNTTVRMYMLAKTDCYVYFDVRDQQENYIFGTNDPISLETQVMGHRAATSIFTYDESSLMNINYGIRWGCAEMLNTELRLLVFYVRKNSD